MSLSRFLLIWLLPALPRPATSQLQEVVLTTVAAVRNLPRAEAEKRLPIRIKAVATYDNPQIYGPLLV